MWCGAPPRGTMAPDWGGITRGAVKLTLFCLINNYRSCQATANYVGSAEVSTCRPRSTVHPIHRHDHS